MSRISKLMNKFEAAGSNKVPVLLIKLNSSQLNQKTIDSWVEKMNDNGYKFDDVKIYNQSDSIIEATLTKGSVKDLKTEWMVSNIQTIDTKLKPKNEADYTSVTENVKDIEKNRKIRQKSVFFVKDDNQIYVRFSSMNDAKSGFEELKKMGFQDNDLDIGQDDQQFPFYVTIEQND
ncbi:hypothetical protein YerA41_210c [Yersinia phage YerA41]|nr:hypothetical protein YerA41_210c [Yersinia phage YerA41]